MKKFLFAVLMAVMAIPMMQAFDRPAAPFALRGNGAVVGTQVKNHDLSKITTKAMLRGENAITWDFEDEAQLEDWMSLDNDGDGYNWYQHINTGSGNYTTHSGDGIVASESYHNNESGSGGTALTPDNWLISPVVELGGGLSLWACGQDASYAAEVFGVYVCVGTPTSINDFVQVGADVTTTGTMTEYKFDLSAYAGQEGCIAIRHYNCYDQFVLVVDDITIDPDLVVIPDPTTPTDVTANPTDVTADIAWTDTDDAGWNLRYREYNPNIGKTYHWSAETDEDLSEWMIWNADGDDYSWSITSLGESAPDGERVFYSASYGSGALDPDEWLITPEVEVKDGGKLTFWAGTYYYPENFDVYLIPDVDDEETWIEIMPKTQAVDGYYNGTGQYYTIDLSPYATRGNARIGFHHYDSYDQYYFFLDDITVEVPGDPEGEWTYVYDIDETHYLIESLTPETTYEVQVQAYNSEGESDWTESTLFTTLAKQELEPTVAPGIQTWTGTFGDHTQYVKVTEGEANCELQYRVKFEDGEWSEWMSYEDVLSYTENGTYEVEARAKAEGKDWSESVGVRFVITPMTGLDEIAGEKAVAGVRYFNVAGQEMAQPEGMTIVVTTYTDGTTIATKVVK